MLTVLNELAAQPGPKSMDLVTIEEQLQQLSARMSELASREPAVAAQQFQRSRWKPSSAATAAAGESPERSASPIQAIPERPAADVELAAQAERSPLREATAQAS